MRTPLPGLPRAPFAAAIWALAGVAAVGAGFRSISDDDYARVSIAERFAEHPRLDPSGTSWLPFPFWILGTFVRVFGPSLSVARGFALASAALAGWLLFRAARAFSLDEDRALVAAILPLSLPLSGCLAAAPTPELPTAALAVFALATARGADGASAFSAALAITAACLSRYEAWPIAIVVAVLLARSRGPIAARLGATIGALAGPVAWLAWNAHAHGSALHFLARVAAFRAGIGARPSELYLGYGLALLREGGLLALVAVLAIARATPEERRRLAPALVAIAALLAFLIAGDVRGGAPTHHPERALYVAFFLLPIVALGAERLPPRALPAMLLAGAIAWGLRLDATRNALGADRSTEVALGRRLRDLTTPDERVLLAPSSFGFLATDAALGRPGMLIAKVPPAIDPRSRDDDPFRSPEALAAAIAETDATWIVATGEQRAVAAAVATPMVEDGPYAVFHRR